jgi:hypothetical protein
MKQDLFIFSRLLGFKLPVSLMKASSPKNLHKVNCQWELSRIAGGPFLYRIPQLLNLSRTMGTNIPESTTNPFQIIVPFNILNEASHKN